MTFRVLLLERALVVLASAIVVWFCLDAMQELDAGAYAPSKAFIAMMLIYSLMLFVFAIRDRKVEKLRKASGLVRPWGEAILGVLGVAAVVFVVLTPGAVSLAVVVAVFAASWRRQYRDLRRLQAAGHLR